MDNREEVAQDDEEISCVLFKKGAKGIVQTWRKRFFLVRKGSSVIEYYRCGPSGNTSEPLGHIEIANIIQIAPTESSSSKKDKKEKEFHFQLTTQNRIYHLYATTEQTMNYWIRSLSKHMKKLKDATPSTTPLSSSPLSSSTSLSSLLSSSSSSSLSSSTDLASEMEDVYIPKSGQLFVSIIEAKEMNLSIDKGHLGVYCITSLERQCVKTSVVSDFSNIYWNEGCFFDITEIMQGGKRVELTVSVWVHDTSQFGGHCVGVLSIPIASLLHQKPVHQAFKLQNYDPYSNRAPKGSLTLKLNFTQTQDKINKDNFEILKVVGKGNFGKVMQVKKKDTGRIYAMKVIRKDAVIAADAVRHTLSETAVLRRINHPFIVNLKYSFQTKEKLYIIMDYLSGGELYHHLSQVDRFPEDLARFYAAEIIEAIGYLHDNNIIYRDLKPENLMLDMSGHVCLTDFGLVKDNISYSDFTSTFCGSPEYLAPEVILGRAYNKEVDWWSFGTFLYEMISGLPPFYDEDVAEMNNKILHAPIYFDPDCFSPEAKSLLRGLLQRDPKLRLGHGKSDHKDIKSHPFFKSINWEKLSRKEIEPSFKPHLRSAEDVRYFDTEFTSQTPMDTPVSQTRYIREDLFAGFTYVSSSFQQNIERRRKLVKPNPQINGDNDDYIQSNPTVTSHPPPQNQPIHFNNNNGDNFNYINNHIVIGSGNNVNNVNNNLNNLNHLNSLNNNNFNNNLNNFPVYSLFENGNPISFDFSQNQNNPPVNSFAIDADYDIDD